MTLAAPPPCAADIWRRGETVFVTHTISPREIEAWVLCVAALSGQPVDWHQAGGRAAVRTTGDVEQVKAAVTLLRPAHDVLMARACEEALQR